MKKKQKGNGKRNTKNIERKKNKKGKEKERGKKRKRKEKKKNKLKKIIIYLINFAKKNALFLLII